MSYGAMFTLLRSCRLLAAVLVVWISFTTLASAGNYNIKECFDGSESDPPGNVTLSCPEDYVISIDEALLGRNKWQACVITEGDCVEKTRIFQTCEGLNNCTRTFKTYSPTCGYSSVLLLRYSCLPTLRPLSSTTKTQTTAEETEIWIQSPPSTTYKSDDGQDDTDDTGLIVGCVVAALVTVIALVIAIVMVIRRLMQYHSKDRDDTMSEIPQRDGEPGATCKDNLSCCSAKQTNSPKSAPKFSSASVSYSSEEISGKTRMAPVGQESSMTDIPGHTDNGGPTTSSNTRIAPEEQQNNTRKMGPTLVSPKSSSDKVKDSGTNLEKDGHDTSPSTYVNINHHDMRENHSKPRTQDINVNDENQNHKDMKNWKVLNKNSIDILEKNNNSHVQQSKVSIGGEKQEQNMESEPAKNDPDFVLAPGKYNESHVKSTGSSKPRFDAVAIPNTENGTAC